MRNLETIEAEKVELRKEIDLLRAEKDAKFGNISIEEPISPEEKDLTLLIAQKYSRLNQLVREKRKLKAQTIK